MPAPPAPPATYEYHRCYLQVDGKKYVRLYSEKYSLLTTGTQGHCDLTSDGAVAWGELEFEVLENSHASVADQSPRR